MKMGKRVPRAGYEFEWDVEEILSRRSCDVKNYDDKPIDKEWARTLERKREDSNYQDILFSIQTYGFVRPMTAYRYVTDDGKKELRFCDGHHRLAAAIELGMTKVPIRVVNSAWDGISMDSGSWTLSRGIDVARQML